MSDLLEYVSLQSVECLNEKSSGDWGKALKQGLRDQEGLVLGETHASRKRERETAAAAAAAACNRARDATVTAAQALVSLRTTQQSAHTTKPPRQNKNKNKESDTDEQLLLHIPFTQKVKLSGIAFAAPAGSGKAPKTVRLFVNRPNVGFSDADSTPAAQELKLAAADLEDGDGAGKTLPLKPARFTGVDVLSIFIEDNQGDEDTTALTRLTLFGTAGETFDVAAIKKVEEK